MARPVIMSYADWIRRTDVAKTIGSGNKTRSGELAEVDRALSEYERNPFPKELYLLRSALLKWIALKTKKGNLSTMRNVGAIDELRTQLDLAFTLWEPVIWNSAYPRIFIARDTFRGNAWVPDDFVGDTTTFLGNLLTRPIGKKLLEDISKACVAKDHKVIIEYGVTAMCAPAEETSNEYRQGLQPIMKGLNEVNQNALASNKKLQISIIPEVPTAETLVVDSTGQKTRKLNYVNGTGLNAVVIFNHLAALGERPGYIGLAHELVHAYHQVDGNCYRGLEGGFMALNAVNSGIKEEEMRTVGFGAYANELPSENAIRVEHGLPTRASYVSGNAWDDVVPTVYMRY